MRCMIGTQWSPRESTWESILVLPEHYQCLKSVNRFNRKPVKIGTFWEPKTAVKNRVDRLVHYLRREAFFLCVQGPIFRAMEATCCVFSKTQYFHVHRGHLSASEAFICVCTQKKTTAQKKNLSINTFLRVGSLFFRTVLVLQVGAGYPSWHCFDFFFEKKRIHHCFTIVIQYMGKDVISKCKQM